MALVALFAVASGTFVEALVPGDIVPVIVNDFETAAFASPSGSSGLAYNTDTGEYAITNERDDEVYIVDTSGVLSSSFDIAVLGAIDARGITYDSDNDRYEIAEQSTDDVYIVDAVTGNLVDQFDISSSGMSSSDGMDFLSGRPRFCHSKQ